jgi:hypothetical protein
MRRQRGPVLRRNITHEGAKSASDMQVMQGEHSLSRVRDEEQRCRRLGRHNSQSASKNAPNDAEKVSRTTTEQQQYVIWCSSMPAKKTQKAEKQSKKVTIDESPNRISMFYRHQTKRENVVDKGQKTWSCSICGSKVTTYTALTAIPQCSGGGRRHRPKQMENK